MCSRIDGENLYIMFSDIVHFWETAELLQMPRHPWEFVQIGNCGSPLETPEGWLLLTHGVGPMRTYCIGAMLLDLNDPLKVIGCLDEPLIAPTERERDGYVPNVAYSCGAMIHNGQLYMPFATSDMITRFAAGFGRRAAGTDWSGETRPPGPIDSRVPVARTMLPWPICQKHVSSNQGSQRHPQQLARHGQKKVYVATDETRMEHRWDG